MSTQSQRALLLIHSVAEFERRVNALLDYEEAYPQAALGELEAEARRLSRDCFAPVPEMLAKAGDSQVRAQIMSMIEHCPSGTLSYTLEPGGDIIEPDLPRERLPSFQMGRFGSAGAYRWSAVTASLWKPETVLRCAVAGLPRKNPFAMARTRKLVSQPGDKSDSRGFQRPGPEGTAAITP
jgi:hypothetical protein